MNLAVIDVGSNTIRLLVACVQDGQLETVEQRTAWVRLGSDVAATGAISPLRLEAAAKAVSEFASEARRLGCMHVETLVASPGRQAENGGDLLRRLEVVSHTPVRLLRRDEEARLAYDGAVAAAGIDDHTVAVCDVGGGSTQLVVGAARTGPAWTRSVDLGAVRLARRALGADPPGRDAIAAARDEAARAFSGVTLPLPRAAYAVGGTARNLARLADGPLDAAELDRVIDLLTETPMERVARRFGISRERARTLPAGAVLLAEAQRRVGAHFTVSRNGLREGAVLALAREAAAA